MILTCDITAVAEQAKQGGVIAYPTEAVFGLGCLPDNPLALQRLLDIKRRPIEKGLILVAANFDQVRAYLSADIQPTKQQMTPDNITWVYPVAEGISPLLRGNFDSIAVRISKHPLVQALCTELQSPITSTSANITGEPPCYSAQAVVEQFEDQPLAPNAVLDGPTSGQLNPTEIRDAISGKTLRHS
ncbi:tRNA threonylcarbamoyladenosine biosynthesis protein RimN [Leucothrix sargassi]|nr:tRNA threonylcarbamoyladenosine biosynthesis protein RimN [Leucothrix sargassi]